MSMAQTSLPCCASLDVLTLADQPDKKKVSTTPCFRSETALYDAVSNVPETASYDAVSDLKHGVDDTYLRSFFINIMENV